MIAGLHLYTAPKGSNRAIAVMIISIHSLYDPKRLGPGNGHGKGRKPKYRVPYSSTVRHTSPDQEMIN